MHGCELIRKKLNPEDRKYLETCREKKDSSKPLNPEYEQTEVIKEIKVPSCLLLTGQQHWILESNEAMASHSVSKLI